MVVQFLMSVRYMMKEMHYGLVHTSPTLLENWILKTDVYFIIDK